MFWEVSQVHLAVLNWAAPAAFTAKHQRCQREVLGALLNTYEKGMGVMLSPLHHYQKGMLWQVEHSMLKSLAGVNINSDRTAALVFQAKSDERDQRPAARTKCEISAVT